MRTKKFKIVCIVDNYSKSKNLRAAFNDESINGMPLNSIFFDKINKNKPYLLISKKSTPQLKPSIEESDQWDILLILDIKVDSSNKFVFADDVLVMWHENAKEYINEETLKEKVTNREIKKYKKGMHGAGDHGYSRLKYLIEAWNGKKFVDNEYDKAKKKLIDWFNVNDELDAALEFLHECLTGTPNNRRLLDAGFDLNSVCDTGKGKGKTINQLINEYNGTPDNIELLETLRDGILEMAGVK